MTEKIIEKMIDYYQGNKRDVAHFLKVYAYARAIGLMEGLSAADQDTLEIAAVVHDIACPFCREKYGSTAGNLQEKESEALLRPFLSEFSFEPAVLERVVQLVCRHHTYTGIDGPDCQILLEADFLVNADEGEQSPQAIAHFRDQVFQTRSGTRLLNSIYMRSQEK